ncbi:hypothetical protein N869_03910 [Cellulomonas bogoriensis 69B4 = DSM 16987]|uniref:Uncharacterized protein n=1 Tax=Cellulomonas bogoriensis 69B4 = DSM 16987 TaxID=1386082 RepID=A0A0A0C1S4_9CELL|nr:hypothetical protein N869_03910 [Cellulomonas bogoriensis 69B4 = DSM 16987]
MSVILRRCSPVVADTTTTSPSHPRASSVPSGDHAIPWSSSSTSGSRRGSVEGSSRSVGPRSLQVQSSRSTTTRREVGPSVPPRTSIASSAPSGEKAQSYPNMPLNGVE